MRSERKRNADRFFPKQPEEIDPGHQDAIMRLAMKSGILLSLESIFNETDDEEVKIDAGNAILGLEKYYEINEATIMRHEGRGNWAAFRLQHRELVGLALEITHLAGKMPEPALHHRPQLLMVAYSVLRKKNCYSRIIAV